MAVKLFYRFRFLSALVVGTIEMIQHRLLPPDTSQLCRPFSVLSRLTPGWSKPFEPGLDQLPV
jgi:hypothetical protein